MLLGADAGVKSSIEDLNKYMAYILQNRYSAVAESFRILNTKQYPVSYFWNVAGDGDETQYYHYGNSPGTVSGLAIYPDKELGVVIITNSRTQNTSKIIGQHVNELLDELSR